MIQIKISRWLICGSAIFLLMLPLPGKALAHGTGEIVTVMTGGYRVSLDFEEPAKVGGNSVHVKILDGTGAPVSDAKLEVSAIPVKDTQQQQGSMESAAAMGGMHDMGGMANMATVPKVALSNELYRKTGDYFGVVAFPASGHWMLSAHLIIDGQMFMADFPAEIAGDYSASFAILAGFAGLNALIIWAAAQTKRKAVFAEPSGVAI